MKITIEVTEVLIKDNQKVMYNQENICEGDLEGLHFKIVGTENRMSHTLICGGKFFHIHSNDVIAAILKKVKPDPRWVVVQKMEQAEKEGDLVKANKLFRQLQKTWVGAK